MRNRDDGRRSFAPLLVVVAAIVLLVSVLGYSCGTSPSRRADFSGDGVDGAGEIRGDLAADEVRGGAEGLPLGNGLYGGDRDSWSERFGEKDPPTVFQDLGAGADLVSTSCSPLGARATWDVSQTLAGTAESVLEHYRASGASLDFDGFIDLFNGVWGCVVSSGEGWSELVLVDGRTVGSEGGGYGDEADRCTLVVVRFSQ